MKTQPQRQFTSLEYIDVIVHCSNSSTRMAIIYRQPPSKKNQLNNTLFFEEFSKRMEQLTILPGNLVILGDFAITIWQHFRPGDHKIQQNIRNV